MVFIMNRGPELVPWRAGNSQSCKLYVHPTVPRKLLKSSRKQPKTETAVQLSAEIAETVKYESAKRVRDGESWDYESLRAAKI
jgi:hypothetical protein